MSKRNIVHVEFPAADQAVAGKFYQELFGWKITALPEMNYTMWESVDGVSSGGLPPVSDENPAGQVVVSVESDDIEADLKRVENSSAARWCIQKRKSPALAGTECFKIRPAT